MPFEGVQIEHLTNPVTMGVPITLGKVMDSLSKFPSPAIPENRPFRPNEVFKGRLVGVFRRGSRHFSSLMFVM
jgi:hypothetical protein